MSLPEYTGMLTVEKLAKRKLDVRISNDTFVKTCTMSKTDNKVKFTAEILTC